jgi:hypothetical protein
VSLQFSRSIRSLSIDSYRPSIVGLILAIITILVLFAWLFFGKVSIYASSQEVQIQGDKASAVFSEEDFKRLKIGQKAILRFSPSQDRPMVGIPAVVYDFKRQKNTVEFLLTNLEAIPGELNLETGEARGRADVEVEYVTPAALLMRSSGKFLNQVQLPVSPQEPANGSKP